MLASALLAASLTLRVFPAQALVDPGTNSKELLFTLEIKLKKGESVPDDWVCPTLVWDWYPGDRSIEESDCTLEERSEPPVRWSRRKRMPGGEYDMTVHLLRAGRTVGSASVTIRLHGGN